jgi:hypothetical protein
MTPRELRIGNDVYYNDKVISISVIGLEEYEYLGDTHSKSTLDRRDYQPIPITEQWLLDFGFERIGNKYRLIRGFHWLTVNCYSIYIFDEQITLIDYVHQLQNLYFALTGTELELKQLQK